MVTTTTFPGLVNIDPIQGLEDYINDIKPYHTKVFELLVEYVYTDYVNVTITDVNNLAITTTEADALDVTFTETAITEAFDFFVTAPAPVSLSIASSDQPNGIVYFAGNVTSDISIGDLLVVDNSPANKFQVLTVGYGSGPNQTTVTLNTLTVSGTTATIYPTDTVYNFAFTILSAVVGPVVVTEPVTGTTFNVSTFTVQGNATRAIQAGSIIQATPTLNPVVPTVYRVAFVQYFPGLNPDGSRNPAGDTSVIGVELDTVFTDAVISTGFLIPYNITGYDDRYDAPYDGMAGYHIVSG